MTEYETISQLKNLREHCRAFSSGEESIKDYWRAKE